MINGFCSCFHARIFGDHDGPLRRSDELTNAEVGQDGDDEDASSRQEAPAEEVEAEGEGDYEDEGKLNNARNLFAD